MLKTICEKCSFWLSRSDAELLSGTLIGNEVLTVSRDDCREMRVRRSEDGPRIGLLMKKTICGYIVEESLVRAILRAGGDVVFLTDLWSEHLESCSGLVLPADERFVVPTQFYPNDPDCSHVNELYTEFFTRAKKSGIPVLGIGFGALVVASLNGAILQPADKPRVSGRHKIELNDGEIFGGRLSMIVEGCSTERMLDEGETIILARNKYQEPEIWKIRGMDAFGVNFSPEKSPSGELIFRWLVERAQYYAVRKSLQSTC